MENLDKKDMCGGANGGSCCGGMHSMCGGHGCHGKHHLIKKILKLILVIIIFWCGFQLGQITGSIHSEYGRGSYNRGGYGMMSGYGYYGNAQDITGGVSVPATPVK